MGQGSRRGFASREDCRRSISVAPPPRSTTTTPPPGWAPTCCMCRVPGSSTASTPGGTTSTPIKVCTKVGIWDGAWPADVAEVQKRLEDGVHHRRQPGHGEPPAGPAQPLVHPPARRRLRRDHRCPATPRPHTHRRRRDPLTDRLRGHRTSTCRPLVQIGGLDRGESPTSPAT